MFEYVFTYDFFRYSLLAITYGNGGHFNCNMKIQGSWYLYDGLREYHSAGTGLQKLCSPKPRQGYRQNYVLYYRNKISP